MYKLIVNLLQSTDSILQTPFYPNNVIKPTIIKSISNNLSKIRQIQTTKIQTNNNKINFSKPLQTNVNTKITHSKELENLNSNIQTSTHDDFLVPNTVSASYEVLQDKLYQSFIDESSYHQLAINSSIFSSKNTKLYVKTFVLNDNNQPKLVKTIIDTGAQISFMSLQCANKLKLNIQPSHNLQLVDASCRPLKCYGTAKITFCVNNFWIHNKIAIIDTNHNFVL